MPRRLDNAAAGGQYEGASFRQDNGSTVTQPDDRARAPDERRQIAPRNQYAGGRAAKNVMLRCRERGARSS